MVDLIFPLISGIEIENIAEILGSKESSVIWDPSEDSIEAFVRGKPGARKLCKGQPGRILVCNG